MKQIIEKVTKKLELLHELSESLDAEQREYVIKLEYIDGHTPIYSLFVRSTGFVLINKLHRIHSWLKIRNIKSEDIYFKSPPK